MCNECAPDLAQEAASAQAHIAADQLSSKMREVDQTGGVDPSAQMLAACPSCHSKLQAGAKFCAGCGKPVAGPAAKAFCTGCGSQLPPGGKFCSGCGQPAG
jgi:predicted amidophosphoribosyltransferase